MFMYSSYSQLATDSELSRQRKIEVAVARQGLGGVVLTQAVKAQDLHANWTRIVLRECLCLVSIVSIGITKWLSVSGPAHQLDQVA